MIKNIITSATCGLLLCSVSLTTQAQVNFVPKPVSSNKIEGKFTLDKASTIALNSDLGENAVSYLKQRVEAASNFKLGSAKGDEGTITFQRGKAPKEGYTLEVSSNGVVITAEDSAGFFYGVISLLQMMPAEIWSSNPTGDLESITVGNCKIKDYPRFAWRGMMLDVSRQFHSKEYVMKFIDRMAQYKLNTFHWHLTDDEGWRIEIKKYPKLTTVGATRGPGTKLPFNIIPAIHGPKDKVQTGFYTQEDIKEVVAYAAARSITIIPEIDVPGHAKAAIVAYPALLQDPNDKSVYKSVQGTPNNTIDPGLETTYTFLDDVIKEVAALFPSKYIHVGGDERPPGAWAKSPSVDALMKKEGLKNRDEVQGYFFQRLEKTLKKYDRTMLGWEEIVHGDRLTRNDTAIMSWHKPKLGLAQAQKGRNVILTLASHLYYDLKYVNHPSEPGLVWAGVTDTKDSYSYVPTPDNLTDTQRKHIRGVHGCLWAETLINRERTDYMAWPRMFALSEIGWTPQKQRSWEDFSNRAFIHSLPKLAAQDIKFRVPLPSAKMTADGSITIIPPFTGAKVHYTLDGSVPTTDSTLYQQPFKADLNTPLKMVTVVAGHTSRVISGYSKPPVAIWKPSNTPTQFADVKFDVTPFIKAPGTYSFSFLYQKGKHSLEIQQVALQKDETQLSVDKHHGSTGHKSKGNTYSLTIKKSEYASNKKYHLVAKIKGGGGTDSHGKIVLSYEPIRPARKTVTNMTAHQNHIADLASDYKDGTWFWLNRAPREGDEITTTWDEPQKGKQAFVVTGKPDGHDQLVSGILEISYDGKTWEKGGDIVFGKAEFDIPEGKAIKAARLRVLASQKGTWLVIRELNVR